MKYTNKQYDLNITGDIVVLRSSLDNVAGMGNSHLAALLSNTDDAELHDILTNHYVEHGVGIGLISTHEGDVTGVGGILFLEDTATYELVYFPLREQKEHTEDVLDYLLNYAFETLGMDKVCVNTIEGTMTSKWLDNRGFAYCGERTYIFDGTERIWNYYELDNEAVVANTPVYAGNDDAGWDSIF